MIGLMVLGLLWIVATYLLSAAYPIPGIGQWNLAIGFVAHHRGVHPHHPLALSNAATPARTLRGPAAPRPRAMHSGGRPVDNYTGVIPQV